MFMIYSVRIVVKHHTGVSRNRTCAACHILRRQKSMTYSLSQKHTALQQNSINSSGASTDRAHHEVSGVDPEVRKRHIKRFGESQESISIKPSRGGRVVLKILRQDVCAAGEDHDVCKIYKNVRYLFGKMGKTKNTMIIYPRGEMVRERELYRQCTALLTTASPARRSKHTHSSRR